MRPSGRSRSFDPIAWIAGVILLGGGLVVLFSLKPTTFLPREWPLGIQQKEVKAYAAWLDRRPVEVGHTLPERFVFGGSIGNDSCLFEQVGPGWRERWLEAGEYKDSVEVSRLLDRTGFLVKCKRTAPIGGQRKFMLIPATVESMRSKYLEVLANDLGLITPSTAFIQLESCGSEPTLMRKEEWVDVEMLERRGLLNASLVRQGLDPERPDQQFISVTGGRAAQDQLRGAVEQALQAASSGDTDALSAMIDTDAAIAWLIMAWLDERDIRSEELILSHQWSTGKMIPIYRTPRNEGVTVAGSTAPLAYNLLTPLLKRPEFRAALDKKLAGLRDRTPEFRERFEALDRSWLPVLADALSMPYAQTSVRQVQHRLLDQGLSGTDLIAFYDRRLYFGPGHASLLRGLVQPRSGRTQEEAEADLLRSIARLKLKMDGDTIVFPRGKYVLDEDLLLPAGRSVLMLEGARIFLAPGRSLVCRGDLNIRGTVRNPVFIRPLDEKAAYGTVAVIGDGSQRCAIRGLFISGGEGATVHGVRHEGMLTLQGLSNTTIINSFLEETKASIALHINGGDVELNGLRSDGPAKGLIFLEHVNGIVRDLVLNGRAGGSKSIGLRISASRLAVVNSTFTVLKGSAVEAIAASQVMIQKGRFTGNGTAIAVSDNSLVHLDGNSFTGNELVMRASRKRSPVGGRVLLYANEFGENNVERDISEGASITAKDSVDTKTLEFFGIPKLDPTPSPRRPVRRRNRS